MTMHLAHPALTLGGKKKGKQKFRNAEEARKSRELAENWQNMQRSWQELAPKFSSKPKAVAPVKTSASIYPPGREPKQIIPSLNGGVDTAPALKHQEKVYTGDKILGIGTMHKSNAVPIFSDNEAKEISSMRR